MSAKERLLSSAQKFILKGQFDRAVKDYEQLVTIDNDIRHRHKLAELLVRSARKDDAVKEYERIAAFYTNNGFYLKSIAVYKQIQKILPNDINVTLSLASLNEKQGLKGNALAEYKTAVDYFDREGNAAEAARVLELMAGIDPSNTNIRHKLAETLFTGGSRDASYQVFMDLVLYLRNSGDKGGYERISGRIRKLFPERPEFLLDLLENQIRSGAPLDAVLTLKQIVKRDPRNRQPWDLLLQAYTAAGDSASRKAVCRQMVRLFPQDPGPHEELVGCLLAERDIDEGLQALGDYSDRFLARGQREKIEALYRNFYEIAPDNVRVLDELQDYYGRTGQEEKQSDILARLAILSSTDTMGAEPHEELFSEEIPSLPQAEEQPVSQAGPWEEEIDLALTDDYYLDIDFDGVEQQALPPAGEPAVEDMVSFGDDFVPDAGTVEDTGTEEETFEPFTLDEIEASFLSLSGPAPTSDEEVGEEELFAHPPSEEGTTGFDTLLAQSLAVSPADAEAEDTETHYDLGCAYREMGLLNEAVSEFRKAAADRRRRVDCIILEGLCHRDRSDLQTAAETLRAGLGVEMVTKDETAALRYELGAVYELTANYAEALKEYRGAEEASPGFRDAAEKIAALASLVGETTGADEIEIDLDSA